MSAKKQKRVAGTLKDNKRNIFNFFKRPEVLAVVNPDCTGFLYAHYTKVIKALYSLLEWYDNFYWKNNLLQYVLNLDIIRQLVYVTITIHAKYHFLHSTLFVNWCLLLSQGTYNKCTDSWNCCLYCKLPCQSCLKCLDIIY